MKNKLEAFNLLLSTVHKYENAEYKLVYSNGNVIIATYDTDYESDNGLDEDEKGYEEYHCIIFRAKENGNLVEVNYHILPEQMFVNGDALLVM